MDQLLPTLVLLTLALAIILAIRQVWAYFERVVGRGTPDDPESAAIFETCRGLLAPTQLLGYAFLGVLIINAAWPLASESSDFRRFYRLGESFVSFLVCSGFSRYILTRVKHQGDKSPSGQDYLRRAESSLREFEWRNWLFTVVFLILIIVSTPDVVPNWLHFLIALGIIVWRISMFLYVARFVRETGKWMARVLSLSLIGWAVAVFFSIPLPDDPAFRLLLTFQMGIRVVFTGLAFAGILRAVVGDMTEWAGEISSRVDGLVRERRVLLDFMAETGVPPGSQDFEETFNRTRLLDSTLRYVMRQVDASAGAVFMAQPGEEYYSAVAVEGLYPPLREFHAERVAIRPQFLLNLVKAERIRPGNGLIGYVARTGETVLLEDAGQDPRVHQSQIDYLRVHTTLAVPLRSADSILGIISLVNKQIGGEPVPFTQHDRWLVEAIVEQASISLNNAQIHTMLAERDLYEMEMRIAQEVQQALLPRECPTVEGYEIEAISKAARRVGGDYYDFLWLSPDHLAIVIADVSGKGVPGSITMAMVKTLLRSRLTEGNGKYENLKEVLCQVNDAVYRDTREDSFVSLTLGVLNIPERTFTFCRAGHEPTLVIPANRKGVEQIIPSGIALGMDHGEIFDVDIEEKSVSLCAGDTFVLYTDGVTEAMNKNGEEFSFERFLAILDTSRGMSAAALLAKIQQEVRQFAGDLPQHDDLTLVIVKVKETVTPKGDPTDAG